MVQSLAVCLAVCLLISLPFWAPAQSVPPWISPDDPLVTTLRVKSEEARLRNSEVRVLWDGLTPLQQERIRAALSKQADVSKVIRLLTDGQRTEAEEQVEKLYAVDKRQAALITYFIGYANGIELPPPASQPPAQGTSAGPRTGSNSSDIAPPRNTAQPKLKDLDDRTR